MQSVDLVDDAAPGAGVDHVGPDARGTPPEAPSADGGREAGPDDAPGGRRRRATLLAVAAGVAAAGLVVAQLVLDAQERARYAAWAQLPGVVAPLGDHLEVAGTIDGELVNRSISATRPAGTLVSVPVAPDGSVDVVSLDLATGDERWRVPALPADARRAAAREPYVSVPPCALGAELDLVACLVSDGFDHTTADGAYLRVPSTWARLVVLDAATGRTVLDREVSVDSSVALAGRTAVVAGIDGREAVVVALDARTGTERWEHRHALARRIEPEAPADPFGRRVDLVAGGGLVAVTDAYGGARILGLEDGAGRRAYGADSWVGKVQDEPGTGAVYLVGEGDGSTLLARPGAPLVELEGYPVPVGVDDGSAPDLVLTVTPAPLDRTGPGPGLRRPARRHAVPRGGRRGGARPRRRRRVRAVAGPEPVLELELRPHGRAPALRGGRGQPRPRGRRPRRDRHVVRARRRAPGRRGGAGRDREHPSDRIAARLVRDVGVGRRPAMTVRGVGPARG